MSLGRYKLLSMIGSGGQAEVYLAEAEQQKFAVKVFKGSNGKQAMKTEAKILSKLNQLNSPRIIRLIESDEAAIERSKCCQSPQTYPIIVLQFAGGGSLKEYIKNSGAFSPNMCRRIIKEILAGIEVIHEFGLAHRDLKPENILIDSSFTLKISDFGIACKAKSKKGLFLQQIVGTPSYQSPQVFGGNYIGLQADLFALGVTLFNLYTGKQPFKNAQIEDRSYKLIMDQQFDLFWKQKSTQIKNIVFQDDFKELMNSMFNANVHLRLGINALKSSRWWNGEQTTEIELITELKDRKSKWTQ